MTTLIQEAMGTLLLSSAMVLLWLLYLARRRNQKQLQERGLALLGKLRNILSNVQKHRGLTSGFHGGNRTLLNEIQTLQGYIATDLNDIQTGDNWMPGTARWQNIYEHWGRLSASFATLEQENCLRQHNLLVTNLLYLIEDTAETHQLHRLCVDIATARLVWKELLVTAEYIGQARALGTGVTAAGHCSSVSRIRLNYLRQKIQETTRRTWTHLDVSAEVKMKLGTLMDCIEQQVLAERPSIESQAYFKLASETLDGVYAQFDREVQSLQVRV